VHAIPFLVVLSSDDTALQWQSGFPTTPGTEAIQAIAEIKGKCAVLALKTILDNGDQITRDHAAQFLGNTLDPDALKILYALLHDADWAVRDNALYSLATLISNQIYDQYTLEKLIEVATNSNEDSEIRFSAARDIGIVAKNQITAKDQAIDVLLQLTKDPQPSIRSGVAQILGDFNEPRVIETLISLLQDQDSLVKSYAAYSLANLTGQDFGQDYVKWNEWWKSRH
jgi:HEAT repeat protein